MDTSNQPWDDLAVRLLAAIEETEQIAKQATYGPWHTKQRGGGVRRDGVHSESGYWVAGADPEDAIHIAHHDPAAVLRRCRADRKIVAKHQQVEAGGVGDHPTGCFICHNDTDCVITHGNGICDTLTLLAEGYGITMSEGVEDAR